MRSVTSLGDAGRQAILRAGARENIDDAADRVRAVQGRARTLDDFDAFNRFWRYILNRGAAKRAWIYAHAVDHDDRMVAVRTAHEQTRRLSWAAIARHFEACVLCKNFADVARQRTLDFLARNDHYRYVNFRNGRRVARGRHHGFFELLG